jgi:aldehyde:ferredoxin oxidoreductase
MALSVVLEWLWECKETGLLTDKNTGLPLSEMGSLEFMDALLKKISLREGFGDVLAQGVVHASDVVGNNSIKLITERMCFNDLSLRTHEEITVDPRLFHEVGLFFAMDMRITKPHYAEKLKLVNGWLRWLKKKEGGYLSTDVCRAIAKKFLGSELAADFSTYEGKALSAKIIHDREAANGSMAFCNYIWPIMAIKNSEDHVGDPALESKVFSAVTGIEVNEKEFHRMGEVIFNVERAIRIREGHRGRESDVLPEFYFTEPLEMTVHNAQCLVPGKNGEVFSGKGTMLDREKFEQMKSDYYRIRGWDIATGLQIKGKLEELGLADVAADIEQSWLIESSAT